MKDYMNSIKNQTEVNKNLYQTINSKTDKASVNTSSKSLESDSFEKTKNKNPDKKKIFKIGTVVLGVVLAVFAFLKRKQIINSISSLFRKKNPAKPPMPPADNIINPKTPPETPSKPIEIPQAKKQPEVDINNVNKINEIIPPPKIKKPTLEQYLEMNKKWELMSDDNPEKSILAKQIINLRKQMIEQNVSFIPKLPESFSSDKERWDYLYRLMGMPMDNEASTLDLLDQFSKIGGKMYDSKTARDSLLDISVSALYYLDKDNIDTDSANRVLQKYIDSVFKFATNEIPLNRSTSDAPDLLPSYRRYTQLMNKDTVIKFINAFKNIAVDKQEYRNIKYFLQDGVWQDFYPKLTPKDMPDIQKALDEFAIAVQNLPDELNKF